MFDLPIPPRDQEYAREQPEEPASPTRPAVETFRPPERFRAEALEYEGGGVKRLLKRIDWVTLLCALAGAAFGYSANNIGSSIFTASLLASAVFLYASRR